MIVGARQSFKIFSDKKAGFFEIIEVCLNLYIGFCINLISIPNYKKSVNKNQFKLTTRAPLIKHQTSLNIPC